MDIASYHKKLVDKLASIGSDTAQIDAQLLICHYMNFDLTDFLLNQESTIDNDCLEKLHHAEILAMQHMPISRILEQREFWGLELFINPHVLDPRADSEILIESLLHFVPQTSKALRILDLGTGSGCLILSILSEYQSAIGIGVDHSEDALKVAAKNAQSLGLDDRCTFIQSDWYKNIPMQKFDIIISNPPYIPSQDIKTLAQNVKAYEPLSALDGGDTGLAPYEIIIRQAKDYLEPNGILILEMGYDQAEPLFDILTQNGFSSDMFDMRKIANQQFSIKLRDGLGYDLGGNPRMIISKRVL